MTRLYYTNSFCTKTIYMNPNTHESASNVLKQFRIIFGNVRRHFHAIEKACGVSGAQVWVLAVLEATPGIRVSELAAEISIKPSTASNLLDKLETAGLIQRVRSQRDQRIVQLYITDSGKTLLQRAPRPFTGLLPYALEQLPEDALLQLQANLQNVLDKMGIKPTDATAEHPLSEL